MSNVYVDTNRKLSTYGGYKTEYIEISSMNSDDIIILDEFHGEVVSYNLFEEDNVNGWVPLSFSIGGILKNELTLKTSSKTNIKVRGDIIYKAR